MPATPAASTDAPAPLTPAELLASIGPPQAPPFDLVFAELGRDAIRLALFWSGRYAGVTGRRADEDEVRQTGCIALWRAWRRCRSWETFPGYWKSYVKNSVLTLYARELRRAEGRHHVRLDRPLADGGTLADSVPDHRHTDPARAAAAGEENLPRLLAGLTPAQAEAVDLVFRGGFEPIEVADRLGVSKQAVHIRLGGAFEKLRESPLARELNDGC